MKKLFILIIILLIFSQIALSLRINEIMYNPSQCSDYDCEWIELYNNETSTIDITNWKINNNDFDDVNLSVGEYLIIARELIDGDDADNESFEYYWGNNDKVWNFSDGNFSAVDGDFGLSNSGGLINLSNGTNEQIFNYTSLVDLNYADGDGNSLQFFNNSWCANMPTPGEENFCPSQPSFIFDYPSYVLNDGTVFLVNIEVSGFSDGFYDTKIDVKDENGNRIGKIYDTNDKEWQSTVYYINNATKVENGSGDYLAYLKIDSDKNYTGTGTIQAKLRFSDNSYTETDLYIFNVVSTTFSEETDEEEQEASSFIHILDVSPSSPKFGDIVEVKINVYRGDTSKYAVYAYIENRDGKKITEKSTIHFKNKFTDYTLTVPLQIKPNCDGKYKDGRHTVIVEGLGESDSEKISIEGIVNSLCEPSSSSSLKEPVCELISKSNEVKLAESQNQPSLISNIELKECPKTVYESTNIKLQKLIPLFIIVLLAILSAVLIWKR